MNADWASAPITAQSPHKQEDTDTVNHMMTLTVCLLFSITASRYLELLGHEWRFPLWYWRRPSVEDGSECSLWVGMEVEDAVWQKVSVKCHDFSWCLISCSRRASVMSSSCDPDMGSWHSCSWFSGRWRDVNLLLLEAVVTCWLTCRPQVTPPPHVSFACRWTLDFGNVSAFFSSDVHTLTL